MAQTPPRVLTIAGSDSGGGAGVQADLKTFAAFGVYGMSAITAVTAQNTTEVTRVHPVPPDVVRAQIEAVYEDVGVDAVKIGMLGTEQNVHAVADALEGQAPRPLVVDPVLRSTSGTELLSSQGMGALVERLLVRAVLVTPNLEEAARLTGLRVESEEERRAAARALHRLGPAVLVTGGHGSGAEVVDLLFDGQRFYRFAYPRIETRSLHGTGCTLSAAITASLAAGRPLNDAVEHGGRFVQQAIRAAFPLGRGAGPVNPLYRFRGGDRG